MNLKRLILIVGVAALLVSKVSAVVICGQPTPEGPTSPPSCPGDPCSKNGGGSGGGSSGGAASCPSKGGVNSFDAQTGNVWRQITDFQLFGVGAERLAFWRLTTSRYEGALPTPLGTAGNWRHSYYWNIYYDGTNSLGLESIHIDYPWGGGNSFDKKTPEDIYMTTASAVTERIEPPAASTNEYSLWFGDGRRLAFYRNGTGSDSTYAIKGLYDPQNNFYPFTLDAKGRVTRVTDPSGRWINFTYSSIGNFGMANVTFTYVSDSATNVAVAGTFNGWSTTANPLAHTGNVFTATIPLQNGSYQYKFVLDGATWVEDPANPNHVPDGYGGYNSLLTVTDANNDVDYGSPTPVSFVYTNAVATNVTVAGQFNGWNTTANPLTNSNGVWTTTINLNSGQYQYKFVVNGSQWVQDPGNPFTVPDGYGGYNSVVSVGPLDEAITAVEGSDGRIVTYNYSMFVSGGSIYSELVQVNYPDGTAAHYTYTSPNEWGNRPLLATADDPRYNGPATRVQYEYNRSTGGVEGFIYQEKSLVTGAVLAQLNVVGSEDSQREVVWGFGGTLYSSFTNMQTNFRLDTLGRTNTYQYYDNGQGMLASASDGLGRTTSYDRMWYFGNVSRITHPDNTTRSFTYTSETKPFFYASITNENGQITRYTYGFVGTVTNLISRIDYPDNSYETFTYNGFAQVLTHRLRNGGIVTNTYDSTGRLITIADPLGNVTSNAYNNLDQLVSVTDARNNTTTFAYNERGQVTSIQHPDASIQTYAYDTYGNRTNMVDKLGHTWSYTYDEYNRMTTMVDPLSRTNSYSYALPGGCSSCSAEAKPTSITDPKGNVIVNVYDTEWQLIAQTNAEKQATSWTYDAVGNRKTQTDANQHTYTWVYDSRNRVIAETNALTQVTRYGYDALGNRTNRVDGAGVVTSWTYDSMNRVTATGSGTLNYEYGYDDGGRRTTMQSKTNNVITETTTYTYDSRDLLLTKVDPTGFTLVYTYDDVGNRATLTIGSVLSQSYTYDNCNRVETITGNGKTTTFGYDAASRRTSAVWPNGSTATNIYDDANQLSAISHQRSGGSTIASFSYGYDRDGNRTNMTTLEGVNTYSYNSNNWLTAATYPDGKKQEFSYDKVGNRTNLIETTATTTNTTVYTYDNANREFSDVMSSMPGGQVVTNLYAWDGAGRLGDILVNEVLTRSFGYSFRSQMTSLTDTNGATFTYDFDGDGNRISAAAGGCLSSRYVYDGPNCVLELNGSNQVTRAYVNGPGIDQPIERIDFLNGTPRTRYVYHTDGLGSVVAMTDYTGAPVGPLVVKSYAYEAFGAIRSETGKVIDRYAFTAREALGDSLGFYFYRNRVMDPNVGRFTSEDPLGFVDGPSLYEYVANKPLDFLDALGLDLGETKCDCNDLCTVLKAVESGKKTLDDLLASGENFAGRDGLVKRLAEKGVRIAGTRGLLSGSLTQTGKSLPKGQGAIYQYFESGEFNQLPGTHDHPSLTLGGEPDTRARMWGDAESTRVGVAINQLKDEVNKRNCKCK